MIMVPVVLSSFFSHDTLQSDDAFSEKIREHFSNPSSNALICSLIESFTFLKCLSIPFNALFNALSHSSGHGLILQRQNGFGPVGNDTHQNDHTSFPIEFVQMDIIPNLNDVFKFP